MTTIVVKSDIDHTILRFTLYEWTQEHRGRFLNRCRLTLGSFSPDTVKCVFGLALSFQVKLGSLVFDVVCVLVLFGCL